MSKKRLSEEVFNGKMGKREREREARLREEERKTTARKKKLSRYGGVRRHWHPSAELHA
jgi:hypothetical protein